MYILPKNENAVPLTFLFDFNQNVVFVILANSAIPATIKPNKYKYFSMSK